MKWDNEKYAQTRDVLKGMLPQLGEGKDEFAPTHLIILVPHQLKNQ